MASFTEADLAETQTILLRAAVQQVPLPGQAYVLRFPDLPAAMEPAPARLSDEHLAPAVTPGDQFEVMEANQLAALAAERGAFGYLRFQAPEIRPDCIRLSLQVCMAFPDVEPLPLGALVASFARDEKSQWTTMEPTAALAY
jgi:hypothetical protein